MKIIQHLSRTTVSLKSTGCFYGMTVHYKPNSFSLIRSTVSLRENYLLEATNYNFLDLSIFALKYTTLMALKFNTPKQFR